MRTWRTRLSKPDGLIRVHKRLLSPPRSSLSGTSTNSSSSYSNLSAALVPIVRVLKLEAQMSTLLHHIHPRMQKSIAEEEDQIDKRIAQQT